ncbi:hypothetical protein PLICRDRAFT_186900 [Plicaturopsis crispa FD-325 SS-3]|nr:hypothetical protein PLICRDRAFT_186900 [Plicaturopsis crispa FD-325 SS-3]
MDNLHFEYTAYSDSSSAPRTPSPRSDDLQSPYTHSPHHYKQNLDMEPVRNIFADPHDDHTVVPESRIVDGAPFWNGMHNGPFYAGSRGSLLQELYDEQMAPEQHEVYSAEPHYTNGGDWQMSNNDRMHMQHQQQHAHVREYTSAPRRATFPYVRRDHPDQSLQQYAPSYADSANVLHHPHHPHHAHYASRQDALYGDDRSPHHLPLSAEPSALHGSEQQQYLPMMSSSPHAGYRDMNVKVEDSAPVMVPSQTPFYRPGDAHGGGGMAMSYLSPHTGLPVQHTDDAASKETQYLRRRCFNCHTTEPPSWRRSTLNPGKIVCNKCGLYERTHLRPRPLRFDELRAGNKSRKQTKALGGSPKTGAKLGALAKKEQQQQQQREYGQLVRRSSVSSSHSGSGTSDWDDTRESPPLRAYSSPA